MKNLNKLLKVIPLVFFIFIGSFYYEVEGKIRSSSSRSSSSRSSSSRSSSSRSSSSRSSSSSKSYSSKSSSSKSSSSKSGTSSSSSSSKSSSSKSGTSSSSSSSKSSSSKSDTSLSDTKSSSGRSSLDTNANKDYSPKESKNIKNQTIGDKKIKANDVEEVFESKGINTTTTKKYYYPTTYRRSILDNPFVRYYLVYNVVEDTIDMVTSTNGYKEDQIIGVVSNENGEEEIIMFEEDTGYKKHRTYFSFTNIIILILIIIALWVFISYKKTFGKK